MKKTNETIQMISVVESGDNYIRFSNGLQIYYDIFSQSYDISINHSGVNVIYPKAFKYDPSITLTRNLNMRSYVSGSRGDVAYQSYSPTGFILSADDSADESGLTNFSYIAIGRWK